jgi:hypothetical protein
MASGVTSKKKLSNQKQEQGNLTLTNKYSSLSQEEDIVTDMNKPEIITPKPPPIFVYGVVNLPARSTYH